ncbi:hypothetical protein [Hymenobacter elongatus]|nr:hypothetical protein [Hymenobacter elongatus]
MLGSGVNSRVNACARAEQNYFEDVRDPVVSKSSFSVPFRFWAGWRAGA